VLCSVFVERPADGFESWVADVGFGKRNYGAFSRDGFLGGEFGRGVFGRADEVSNVILAGFALVGFPKRIARSETLVWL